MNERLGTYCLILSFLGPNLGPDGPRLKIKYPVHVSNDNITQIRKQETQLCEPSSWILNMHHH